MAFNDLEYHAVKKEVEAFVESKRPPVHIRDRLDMIYKIDDQTVVISGVRPTFMGQPGETMEQPYAKLTYARTQKIWNVFWMRGTFKWELYSSEQTLEAALNLVRDDIHGCFFG